MHNWSRNLHESPCKLYNFLSLLPEKRRSEALQREFPCDMMDATSGLFSAVNTQRRDGIDKEEFFMPRIQVDYYSFSLNMNTHATVILPQTGKDFLSGGVRRNRDGKIPVLWLLHGFGDDSTSWERYTHVERYALARGIAVVMPGVLSQCFTATWSRVCPTLTTLPTRCPRCSGRCSPSSRTRRRTTSSPAFPWADTAH